MKRPRTTSFSAPPPGQAPAPELPADPTRPPPPLWRETAPIVAALLAALDAAETAPKAGPAAKVHRAALRRQGETAVALGGVEALEAVLRQVAEADPSRARMREAALRAAWGGLIGPESLGEITGEEA